MNFSKYQSPEKPSKSGSIKQDYRSDSIVKQQAYKLEECQTQINNMYTEQDLSKSVDCGLEWSKTISDQNSGVMGIIEDANYI